MKKHFFRTWMVLCAWMMLLTSCEHRELSDPNTGHYVRIYLDEEIKNVTYGFYDESLEKPEYKRPHVMRVLLTDPESGSVVSERYLQNQGEDERGYYIDGYIGAEAGTYNLLAYDFGSAVTLIRNEQDYYRMQAYTNPINDYYLQYLPSSRHEMDEKSIVYQPEHLFHVASPLVIPKTNKIDTLKTATGDFFTAHSVVKSYFFQIRIKGVEWVKSAVSTISGMAGATYLHGCDQLVTPHPVNLFFTLNYTNKKSARDGSGSTALLYATFNTFGKLPEEESVLTLNFEFVKPDGSSQVETLNLTWMFDTPIVRDQQHLLVDHEIVITPPENAVASGGMTPGVEGWQDVEGDVEI
ncbi:MAG: DUF5119 domain-containing protein [Bacteroides sp.]|nr:DUF5119 domain-containing protein [Bacteroides sp.]